jgi:hypothetical protein
MRFEKIFGGACLELVELGPDCKCSTRQFGLGFVFDLGCFLIGFFGVNYEN